MTDPTPLVISARGAQRRIQALVAAGWSLAKIADRLGYSEGGFARMMRRDTITAHEHHAACALFDALWAVQPPCDTLHDRAAYTRSRNYARARRWVPALAWDDIDLDPHPPIVKREVVIDEIAIELALDGQPPRLTPLERRECVRRLHAKCWSDARIAHRIGCAEKTVERIRVELELPPVDGRDIVAIGAA